jgi:hypothetical protein
MIYDKSACEGTKPNGEPAGIPDDAAPGGAVTGGAGCASATAWMAGLIAGDHDRS